MARDPILHLTLPHPPSTNHRSTIASRRGRIIVTQVWRDYKQAVYGAFLRQVKPPFPYFKREPLTMVCHVYPGSRPQDVDNPIKGLLDALKQLAYQDDKAICDLHVYRMQQWGSPRVEVALSLSSWHQAGQPRVSAPVVIFHA